MTQDIKRVGWLSKNAKEAVDSMPSFMKKEVKEIPTELYHADLLNYTQHWLRGQVIEFLFMQENNLSPKEVFHELLKKINYDLTCSRYPDGKSFLERKEYAKQASV